MTAEDRYVFDLGDVRAVRFECKACSAAVSIRLASWDRPPHQCPACSVAWTVDSQRYELLEKLSLGLRAALANEKIEGIGYRLRFEIDRPKN